MPPFDKLLYSSYRAVPMSPLSATATSLKLLDIMIRTKDENSRPVLEKVGSLLDLGKESPERIQAMLEEGLRPNGESSGLIKDDRGFDFKRKYEWRGDIEEKFDSASTVTGTLLAGWADAETHFSSADECVCKVNDLRTASVDKEKLVDIIANKINPRWEPDIEKTRLKWPQNDVWFGQSREMGRVFSFPGMEDAPKLLKQAGGEGFLLSEEGKSSTFPVETTGDSDKSCAAFALDRGRELFVIHEILYASKVEVSASGSPSAGARVGILVPGNMATSEARSSTAARGSASGSYENKITRTVTSKTPGEFPFAFRPLCFKFTHEGKYFDHLGDAGDNPPIVRGKRGRFDDERAQIRRLFHKTLSGTESGSESEDEEDEDVAWDVERLPIVEDFQD